MASFFQPVAYNSNTTLTDSNDAPSRFLVYTNSVLSPSELFQPLWHLLLFLLGLAALSLPLLKVAQRYIFSGFTWVWRKQREGGKAQIFQIVPSDEEDDDKTRRKRKREGKIGAFQLIPSDDGEDEEGDNSTQDTEGIPLKEVTRDRPSTLVSIKTFGYLRQIDGDVDSFLELPYDLHIVPIHHLFELDRNRNSVGTSFFSSGSTIEAMELPTNTWAAINEDAISTFEAQNAHPEIISQWLSRFCIENGLGGVVIDSEVIKIPRFRNFLSHLAQDQLQVILLTDASHPMDNVDINLLCGKIYTNACILPTGQRRDFFQAAKLRSSLSRVAQARNSNPGFFVAFHDLWDYSPSPAVIRRSHKFSNFNGAVFAHGLSTRTDHPHSQACLSAFDWIKRDDTVQAQRHWMEAIRPIACSLDQDAFPCDAIKELEILIPGIIRSFDLVPPDRIEVFTEDNVLVEPPSLLHAPLRSDFWRVSSQGKGMCLTGCYDLREEVFDEQYHAILTAQEHLRNIKMLQDFHERDLVKTLSILDNYLTMAPRKYRLITDLVSGLRTGTVRIFQGLDSGFTLPDCQGHFWAVSQQESNTSEIAIYLSLKTPDLISTIVHCYLAQFGVPRERRLEIEMEIIISEGKEMEMHPRLANELSSATYSELLFLIQQISITSTKHPILDEVLRKCEYLLIEEPTRLAYVKTCSEELLARRVNIRDILEIRLGHLTRRNFKLVPNIDTLVRTYTAIDDAILEALLDNDESLLELLIAPVHNAYKKKIDSYEVSSDLYALFFFTSLRRRAFEEVYMETTDRCPLFLQSDQAAVFAELWMLGSQCEIYFGIKPRALGRVIYDEYRAYLKVYAPPVESWDGVNVFTAYSKGYEGEGKNATLEPRKSFRARLYKASFLTIFCVPAMIDIGLLTFVGRGLYLTAFMSLDERIMANYAILSSLLITAGVTGWSGSTGGYYLYQSAYINMNHFMVHSLSGGFMITLLLAACGFLAFAFQYSWYAGGLFAAYLIVLTTYLNLLGIMATMHRDEAPFTSGRLVLGKCMLITLISPIITSFVNGHDVLIYLIVLYIFLGVLIYNYAQLCHKWGSWPDTIVIPKEQEILNWYLKKTMPNVIEQDSKPLSTEDAKLLSQKASEALMIDIDNCKKSSKFRDSFTEMLAPGHKYVVWLLKKESNGQPLPPPYSGAWLIQTKLALANQQQLGRGLKEHSPFLLFRNAKYDIAQNVGLFLIALMDRWVAISLSANGHIVNMYYNSRARYGVAFSLLYFLLCAVSLDIVLQRYWGHTGRQYSERLANIFDFESTEVAESRREKRRWLRALLELFWVMVGIFGLTTICIWLFVIDSQQIINYLAYVIGYSCVIVFQFNRVFTMDIKRHVQIVFLAALFGYLIGVILHEIPVIQDFYFNNAIALCTSSITAAFGTWLNSDFCDDASKEIHVETEEATNWKLHSQKLIGVQRTCSRLNTAELENINGTECCYDDNSPLSSVIKQVIAGGAISTNPMIPNVFPRAKQTLQSARAMWSRKKLRIITVSREDLAAAGGEDIFAGSYKDKGILTIIVGLPAKTSWKNVTVEAINETTAQLIAEAMLHEYSEAILGLSHADSTLMELLLNPHEFVSTRMFVQFAWSSTSDLQRISVNTNSELLHHLALGCDMNVEWEDTPEEVRKTVVSRAIGRQYTKNKILHKWLSSRRSTLEIFDLHILQCLAIYDAVVWRLDLNNRAGLRSKEVSVAARHWKRLPADSEQRAIQLIVRFMWGIYDRLFLFLTFVATISRAGFDCGRETWFTLGNTSLQPFLLWFILKIWKVCLWSKNFWVRIILLHGNKTYKQYHQWLTQGAIRKLTDNLVVETHPRGTRSGFLSYAKHGFNLRIYDGAHDTEPENKMHISASYDKKKRLQQLCQMEPQTNKMISTAYWIYSYDEEENFRSPAHRTKFHQNASQDCNEFYDEHDRIVNGECLKNNKRFRFVYNYDEKMSQTSSNVLSAIYTSIDLDKPLVVQIFWCLPALGHDDVWIPSERPQYLVRATEGLVEEVSWSYDHKRDPVIKRKTRSSDSESFSDPELIVNFQDDFGILVKPVSTSFIDEDLLYFFKLSAIEIFAADPAPVDKYMGDEEELKVVRRKRIRFPLFQRRARSITTVRKLPTAVLRTSLWKQWMASTTLDAMTSCIIDEMIVRQEPLLKKYWSLRDNGKFAKAKSQLEIHLESIISSIELADEISQKVNLAIKPADLFSMGLSKDANFVISRPEETYIDTDNRLAVIFTDTGCWPDAPGGVSNCRRDLVEGHSTIRNYALTESANEYGIPRFQIERNVQLIKNLPLWGLDGKSPTHGLYENLLQSQVDTRIRNTRVNEDIEGIFVPLLTAWVRGCRTYRLTKENLTELTDVILNINSYFEENDYLTTWRSKEVRKAWREAWLCEYSSPNISNPNDSLDIEQPTAPNFDAALDLYISYFFIFSIQVPQHVPRVYQSTHHGISSLYGMILKIRRGTTWGIWDHAIMLRESLLNVSPAQCILPIAVQTMLLGSMRVAAHLAYVHADIILPCTAIYNPTWEAEIGSDQGMRSSFKLFQRKIDPITNGISSMDKFKPVGKPRTSSPTVIMLSNVQFIKDVKNAVLAAGIIINNFGFKDYNLIVYGAQDRQPSYAIETEEMIAEMGIGANVKLGGFGSPSEVLKDAWLFMNSSLSEGLPLAIGEAALSGVAIVATEVGATAQVLTDADDPNVRYGEIVPPNDPIALARAQIQLLSMLGPWAKYTTDDIPPPPLPSKFTDEDVEWISARMHEKAADRQALGLRLRDVVLRKFNGDRYLREHEQMFWVQRHMATHREDPVLEQYKHSHPRFGEPIKPAMVEPSGSTLVKGRWQEFNRKKLI